MGEEAAFKELFVQITPVLDTFLIKLTKGEAETNELIQEVFIRIWLSRHLLTDIDHPRSWIYGIASHVSFAWIKNKMRRRALLNQVANLQNNTSFLQTVSQDKRLYLHDLKKLVSGAIDRLSPQRRKIYLLSREKGMTIPEIAAYLKLSSNTVKNTLVAALGEIRDRLKSEGYELPILILAWLVR